MDSPMGSQGTGGSRRSGQVSLADLCFLVLAAGLAAGVVRRAREVWGTGLSRWGSNGWSPTDHFERTAGLAVEVASIWLALILAHGILRLVRGPRSGGGPGRVGLLGMMGWRVPAIALLLGFTMRESQVLGVDLATYRALAGGQEVYGVSVMLVPICAILTIIGVALGMGAGMSLPRASPARARPYWLFVPLAALAAVLFMAQPGGECTLIPQFILVVLDFVIDAMPPPGVRLPGSLAVRLLRAGIEAVPAALACLWLALVVAHDFERARRDQPWAMGRGGWILRILSLVVALAAGTVVVGVAIPTMHPCLLDGFREILETESIAMVLGGFGVLAAGLAARALVPPPSHEAPRRLRRLSRLLPAGMIVDHPAIGHASPALLDADRSRSAGDRRPGLRFHPRSLGLALQHVPRLDRNGSVRLAQSAAARLAALDDDPGPVPHRTVRLPHGRKPAGAVRCGGRVARAIGSILLARRVLDHGLPRRRADSHGAGPGPGSHPLPDQRLDDPRLAVAVLSR